jgi:hypothetical protein
MEKHITIPPLGIFRVSQRYPLRIPAVPSVFGRLDFFEGGLFSKGRKRWAWIHGGGGSHWHKTEDRLPLFFGF